MNGPANGTMVRTMRFALYVLLWLAGHVIHAQPTDTWLTADSTLRSYLQRTDIFDRTKRWDMGGNWGGLGKASNILYGINLMDGSDIAGAFATTAADSRLLLVNGPIMYDYGIGLGIRIDPELIVTNGTTASEPASRNSGASHGFATASGGDVPPGAHYRRFRQGRSTRLSSNTNADLMFRFAHSNFRCSIPSVREKPFRDAMRSGEFLFAGILVRRPGRPDPSANPAEVILRLRIRNGARGTVRFSAVPGIPAATGSGIAIVGTDTLPRLTPKFDTLLFPIGTTNALPLLNARSYSGTVHGERRQVWTTYRDTRQESGATAEDIVITRGMLDALPPASADGSSGWTMFDGLLVLPAPDADLCPWARSYPEGLGHTSANLPLRTGSNQPEQGYTARLDVEVVYEGAADIDIDNVTIGTPTLRALHREMFRTAIEAEAARSIHNFMKANGTGTHRLIGLRAPEELGESAWLAQRYLNILLNGMMLTETHYHPAGRYLHVAYPLGTHIAEYWNADTTVRQRPMLWMDGTAARNVTFTPAPYMKYGAQSMGEAPWATFNIKHGLCKQYHGRDTRFCACAQPYAYQRAQADAYETGFDEYGGSFLNLVRRAGAAEYLAPWTITWPRTQAPIVEDANSMPSLLRIEHTLYTHLLSADNHAMLFGQVDWYDQLWLGSSKMFRHVVNNDSTSASFGATEPLMFLYAGEGRPHTAEEVRLRLHLQGLLLGSSGMFVFFGGAPTNNSFDAMVNVALRDIPVTSYSFLDVCNLAETIDAASPSPLPADSAITRSLGDTYGADYPLYDAKGHPYLASGAEYVAHGRIPMWTTIQPFPGTARTVSDVWVDGGMSAVPAWTTQCASGSIFHPNEPHAIGGWDVVRRITSQGLVRTDVPLEERMYIGMRSIRNELATFAALLNRRITDDAQGTATWRQLLSELELQAWYAKGYKTHEVWDTSRRSTNPLRGIVALDSIRSRHPERIEGGVPDYEAIDSSFFDVTMLRRASDTTDSEFYIGVQNRRTSPLYEYQNDIVFSSAVEYGYLVRSGRISAWGQFGSRIITFPFRYGTGGQRLHITELGVSGPEAEQRTFDGRTLLDTVISGTDTLEVRLRPGEGKLFRVRITPTVD